MNRIKHPRYDQYDKDTQHEEKNTFDIGLIKLGKEVGLSDGTGHFDRNIICLPQKNFTVKGRILAMIAGRGIVDRVQIGSMLLHQYQTAVGHRLVLDRFLSGAHTCMVKAF